jgi:nucleoid DNA-binding protein|tara:strand:+ start:6906 stop:7178 length:273 start_codon:yes stop_codon:yes gene_type:complete
MGFGKKDIVKNVSSKALISSKSSSLVLEAFLGFIKQNKRRNIKISNFGTFYLHKTPARLGRNPKTKEEFKILPSEKLAFKASNKVKSFFN